MITRTEKFDEFIYIGIRFCGYWLASMVSLAIGSILFNKLGTELALGVFCVYTWAFILYLTLKFIWKKLDPNPKKAQPTNPVPSSPPSPSPMITQRGRGPTLMHPGGFSYNDFDIEVGDNIRNMDYKELKYLLEQAMAIKCSDEIIFLRIV